MEKGGAVEQRDVRLESVMLEIRKNEEGGRREGKYGKNVKYE